MSVEEKIERVGRLSPMGQAAAEAVIRGWAVLPLKGKLPLTEHGVQDASEDWEQVCAWWERWPDANVGGRVPEHLVVLDVDPRNGGDVAQLGLTHMTMTAWSGRGDGGCHLYYLRPPQVTLSGARLPRGVDLKTSSGYCVLPPSVHPETGHPYAWDLTYWEAGPTELPPHLLSALRAPERDVRGAGGAAEDFFRRPMTARRGVALYEVVATAAPGERNNLLHWAACRFVEALEVPDWAVPVLTEAGQACGLSDMEISRTLRSAGLHA